MSGLKLSEKESYVLQQIRVLNRELDALRSHRDEMAKLEARIWSARSQSPAGTQAYGAPAGSYGPNVAAGAYVSQASQELDDRLKKARSAETGLAERVRESAKTLEQHGGTVKLIRDEVKRDLEVLCTQCDQLQGEQSKALYRKGEDRYRPSLHKCDDILRQIQLALQIAGTTLSGNPQPSAVGGLVTTPLRGLDAYILDTLKSETLYALAMRRNEGIDGTSEPPSPRMAVSREQGTGSLEDTIGAGLGYATLPVADEYKIPLPKYYYERYRRDCNPHDSQGKYLVRE